MFTKNPSLIPTEPIQLSYWIAKNLPLDIPFKQKLLALDLHERLLEEVKMVEKFSTIYCMSCHTQLGYMKDLFVMTKEGPQAIFVNRYGSMHETLTFTKLSVDPLLYGRPSTQDSWFPGYVRFAIELNFLLYQTIW